MKRVCVTGESPLLDEYCSLLLNKRLEVHGRVNGEKTAGAKPPNGVKPMARPPRTAELALELTTIDATAKRKNLLELDASLPRKVPILTSSVTCLLSEQASWLKHPARLVGIGALPSLLEGGLIETTQTPATDPAVLTRAAELFALLGKDQSSVADSIGMVLPRILCGLINEAYFAIMDGVAPPRELDTAMRLGTNYPHGPIEWGERIGLRHVHAVLASLHAFYGEERYRPAPALVQAVRNLPLAAGV